MNGARYVGIGLFAIATHAQAGEWADNDINEILTKVRTIYTDVTGDIKDAAQDLVSQQSKRAQTMTIIETVEDVRTWFQSRRTPFLDFSGGTGRCPQGSPCAQFRADLRTFALHMAELKDRYPVLNQYALGDTTLFSNMVNAAPAFVLFGPYEILRLIPDWQDLPVDLADIYDEIGDPEVFSIALERALDVSAASIDTVGKKALATDRMMPAAALSKEPKSPANVFCAQGKSPNMDAVRFNKRKDTLFRWKNRFDSWSEYPPDFAVITLAGEGTGAWKVPISAFIKTVSNAIDNILNMVTTYEANLEVCAKIEADVAARAPMVQYRTAAGVRNAYWVIYGIVNRPSSKDAGLAVVSANAKLQNARVAHALGRYKEAYGYICDAYEAL